MTTDEIKELRAKLVRFADNVGPDQKALVSLEGKELKLIEHLLRSRILWNEWLLPDE